MVAAAWIPHDDLATDDIVRPEFIWAALDCPGGFAGVGFDSPTVLGRIATEVTGRVDAGERCVVIGWPVGHDGRKHFAGTALFGEDGRLVGKSYQTWIEIK